MFTTTITTMIVIVTVIMKMLKIRTRMTMMMMMIMMMMIKRIKNNGTCLFGDSSDVVRLHSTARSNIANPHIVSFTSIPLHVKPIKQTCL